MFRIKEFRQIDAVPQDKPETPVERKARAAIIARRLSELRRENHMSQDSLGSLVGASQATVSRWEDVNSLSTPSALEVAEIADHFGVEAGWVLGARDSRQALPVGAALVDQGLLDAFTASKTPDEFERLLESHMAFGTLWVQIPAGAEVVTTEEALRRVKKADRHIRKVQPDLWREWAEIVLR